ncbi:hypothetical protein Fmac_018162 [Flemingia macrophylla]|uniref:DM8 domain-containing protein n=1 Tax=Flemingia macrophylla TaxID=520843 RepID=A0ABD1M475_9FABA
MLDHLIFEYNRSNFDFYCNTCCFGRLVKRWLFNFAGVPSSYLDIHEINAIPGFVLSQLGVDCVEIFALGVAIVAQRVSMECFHMACHHNANNDFRVALRILDLGIIKGVTLL